MPEICRFLGIVIAILYRITSHRISMQRTASTRSPSVSETGSSRAGSRGGHSDTF